MPSATKRGDSWTYKHTNVLTGRTSNEEARQRGPRGSRVVRFQNTDRSLVGQTFLFVHSGQTRVIFYLRIRNCRSKAPSLYVELCGILRSERLGIAGGVGWKTSPALRLRFFCGSKCVGLLNRSEPEDRTIQAVRCDSDGLSFVHFFGRTKKWTHDCLSPNFPID